MTVRIGYQRRPAHDVRTRTAPRRHFPVALATWAAGAGLFLGLAGTVTTVALSTPDESVAADQQARTDLAAGQVRRALDRGVSDLTTVATGIEALADAGTPGRLLAKLVSHRYAGAAYLSPTGEVRARAGAAVTAPATPGVLVRGGHVVVAVPVTGPRAGLLVAELASDALSVAVPGDTRVYDSGHVPGDMGGSTLARVPGRTGLTVVTVTPEPYRATAGHELLLFGVLVATLTVVIFGWLYALVIGPLSALAKAADRLARGDTADPVIVRRYDRLGLIARDLERARRHLLRRN